MEGKEIVGAYTEVLAKDVGRRGLRERARHRIRRCTTTGRISTVPPPGHVLAISEEAAWLARLVCRPPKGRCSSGASSNRSNL